MSSKIKFIDNLSDEEFLVICSKCYTKKELHDLLRIPISGTYTRIINSKFKSSGAELRPKKLKYERIIKLCPVCKKEFEVLKGHKREKVTCGYSCSNTYFRSGINNPNHIRSNGKNYRVICEAYHKKECVVCGFLKVLEVHHIDENNKNNNPENLIWLCPNHHRMYHSRFKDEIVDYIEMYLSGRTERPKR